MTKKYYMELHATLCEKMIEITAAKNHDYTGVGDDPFSNFRNVKNCGGGNPLQGFLFRMNDKMSRVSSFVEKGILKVADEKVEDTLLDLANYALLMIGYIADAAEGAESAGADPSPPKDTVHCKHVDWQWKKPNSGIAKICDNCGVEFQ